MGSESPTFLSPHPTPGSAWARFDHAESLTIIWPSGTRQVFQNLPVNRVLNIGRTTAPGRNACLALVEFPRDPRLRQVAPLKTASGGQITC